MRSLFVAVALTLVGAGSVVHAIVDRDLIEGISAAIVTVIGFVFVPVGDLSTVMRAKKTN